MIHIRKILILAALIASCLLLAKADSLLTAQQLYELCPIPRVTLRMDPYLEENLRLVNKKNKLKSSFVPELREVNVAHKPGLAAQKMRPDAADALEEMFSAALEDGIELYAVSGYRSYGTQRSIYQKKVAERGESSASLSSAPPGASEHQLGLAMDISAKSISYRLNAIFADSDEGKWLAEHCAEYGFIIRYKTEWKSVTSYKGEPWHVRYVGKEHAAFIQSLNVPFETYMEYLYLCWCDMDTALPAQN